MPTINQLSSLDVLQDNDQLVIYSATNGDARKISAYLAKQYFNGVNTSTVTMKQLRTWLAINGFIVIVDNNIPADISNQLNVLWHHSGTIRQNDALYVFIQTTLGYTSSAMAVAFEQMQELEA